MHTRQRFHFTCLASLASLASIAVITAACTDTSQSAGNDAGAQSDAAQTDAPASEDGAIDASDGAACTAGSFTWAISGGGPGQYDDVLGTARDKDGNTWVAGTFIGAATWGSQPALAGVDQVHTTAFFAKIDPTGKVLLARSLGAKGTAERIRVDAQGNAYIGGTFDTSLTIDGVSLSNANSGSQGGFVVALDPTGHATWGVATAGTGSRESIHELALDSSGDVFVAGSYNGQLALGNNTSAGGSTSDEAVFVARYSHAQGKWLWAQGWSGPTANSGGQGVALARTGDGLVVGATIANDVDLGDAQIFSSATGSFLVKVDPNDGHKVWAAEVRAQDDQHEARIKAIAADGNGNVYATGFFNGTASFDPPASSADAGSIDAGASPALTAVGGTDLFVAKVDPSGAPQWQKQAHTDTTIVRGDDIVWDGANAIYVGGFHQGPTTFAGSSVAIPDTGNGTAFVARYDLAGNVAWASTNANNQHAGGEVSALAIGGGVLVGGGSYDTETTFGATHLASAGQDDAFVIGVCP